MSRSRIAEVQGSPESQPYKVETASLAPESLEKLSHPLDSSIRRLATSLGDRCGLSKVGIHFCRVAPHQSTTVVHWHNNDDEWFYIVDAGTSGGTLVIHQEGDAGPREEPIQTGDFLGFPAGKRNAHAIRAGEQELVYLCGGSRESVDVCRYPLLQKTLVIDRTEGGNSWFVENKDKEDR